jgi:hypothetical protein
MTTSQHTVMTTKSSEVNNDTAMIVASNARRVEVENYEKVSIP